MKLSQPNVKILEALKTKEMNSDQIASSTGMDRNSAIFYLGRLGKNGYATSGIKEEREGDKPILRRYYSVTEKGLKELKTESENKCMEGSQ